MNVKPRVAIASKSECLVRGAEVGFEVSNGGIVPRRLVVELSLNCMDCIGFSCLRFAFCFGFPASVVCAGSCGKAERPPETRHDCAVFFKSPPAVLLKIPRSCWNLQRRAGDARQVYRHRVFGEDWISGNVPCHGGAARAATHDLATRGKHECLITSAAAAFQARFSGKGAS